MTRVTMDSGSDEGEVEKGGTPTVAGVDVVSSAPGVGTPALGEPGPRVGVLVVYDSVVIEAWEAVVETLTVQGQAGT